MAKQQKKTKAQKEEMKKGKVQTSRQPKKPQVTFPLGKENYFMIIIGLVVILIGYILMAGKEDIFSFTKMYISVIFVIFGYFFIIYAILKKPRKKEEDQTQDV